MKEKTLLKDIAKHVGVSTALVSYVINNKEKEARVGQEMVKKIRQAVIDLNYQPNLIAKSLKSGKTKTIGLIVADISNPFFSAIARIIEDEARKLGYVVIFGSSDESAEKSQELINVFLNRQVDAFIIAPAANTENQILALQKSKIPVVLIDRYFSDLPVDKVHINNASVSERAVDYLIEQGRKHIAMLTYKTNLPHLEERKMGYKKALRKHRLKFDKGLIREAAYADLESDVNQQMRAILQRRPKADAIFFATNSLAVAGLRAINAMGVKVPQDLAIVTFDQGEAFDFFYAPLSYIFQSLEEIGQHAVELLVGRINQKSKKTKYTTIVVDAKLIIRNS